MAESDDDRAPARRERCASAGRRPPTRSSASCARSTRCARCQTTRSRQRRQAARGGYRPADEVCRAGVESRAAREEPEFTVERTIGHAVDTLCPKIDAVALLAATFRPSPAIAARMPASSVTALPRPARCRPTHSWRVSAPACSAQPPGGRASTRESAPCCRAGSPHWGQPRVKTARRGGGRPARRASTQRGEAILVRAANAEHVQHPRIARSSTAGRGEMSSVCRLLRSVVVSGRWRRPTGDDSEIADLAFSRTGGGCLRLLPNMSAWPASVR